MSNASPPERAFAYLDAALVGADVRTLQPATVWEAAWGEGQARRRDGRTFLAELTVTGFRFDGERRFTGVVRDVTSRKKLGAEFR